MIALIVSLALSGLPAQAERALTTSDQATVFIASGTARASFGTVYMSDGGRDRARLETELGYAGIGYERYVTLSNANARDMLLDADMVTALPLRLLAEPFAVHFFENPYFAFVATPSGLEPVSVTRPDGKVLAAQDLGPLAEIAPAPVGGEDGATSLLATAVPLVPGPLDIRRYGMTIPRDWLGEKLASADMKLGELSEIGAEGLAAAVAAPGEAVIFLAQHQRHPTLAPVFEPTLGARFYVVTNFGLLPARPEAAPEVLAPPDPAPVAQAKAEPAPDVAAAEPQERPVAEAVVAASDPGPYFDLSSAEVYVVLAEDRAALDEVVYVYVPRVASIEAGTSTQIDLVSYEDHGWRQQAVRRYLTWIAADRGGDVPAFSSYDRFRIIDGSPFHAGQLTGKLPAILSSQLARPEFDAVRAVPGLAYAVLDRHGITPIRPVVGRPPGEPVLTIPEGQDEGFADRHRRARTAPESYIVLPPDGAPLSGVYLFTKARKMPRRLDLSMLPEALRGPEAIFAPKAIGPIDELPTEGQLRMLNEPGMAFVYGRNWLVDFFGDPVFDRLFTGDRAIVDLAGTPLDLPVFPASALRDAGAETDQPAMPGAGFCGVTEGPLVLAGSPREPGAGQGMRFFVAGGDSAAVDHGTAAGFGRARQYHTLPDAVLRERVTGLNIMEALVFSGPGVPLRIFGADFECGALFVAPL
ncbi:hypothetical protein [Salipiger abyssi]|uniref:hypothetical protein n=1 Tax=Salipiger abyssi TaxID=1250539 RepID=UPI001A8D27B0|nr:hypothetical protein [Salipiger abyssi]MBN9887745.1 hypothetical protein [Salipiger abyssi]